MSSKKLKKADIRQQSLSSINRLDVKIPEGVSFSFRYFQDNKDRFSISDRDAKYLVVSRGLLSRTLVLQAFYPIGINNPYRRSQYITDCYFVRQKWDSAGDRLLCSAMFDMVGEPSYVQAFSAIPRAGSVSKIWLAESAHSPWVRSKCVRPGKKSSDDSKLVLSHARTPLGSLHLYRRRRIGASLQQRDLSQPRVRYAVAGHRLTVIWQK